MRKLFLLLLTILAVSMSAAAQTRTVRGIVISGDDNEPIVGASVMVVGTQLGSSTDVEGKFVIKNVPSDAKSLRVSYVGMTSQDVPITKGEIRIVLGLNSELLDEVVVTALGISRSEKSLGYSATQVGAVEIERAQSTNVMQALQGKVAGLQIQTTSSDPGTANNVSIRGLGSINGSNQPLYVVDGVPLQTGSFSGQGHAVSTGGISNISPDDIASLTVLKGAAATSLYGSRASNGVIIITTKNGGKGDGKNYTITYSGNVEASRISLLPEMQNKWGQGWNGNQTYIENGSWGPALDGSRQVYGPIWNHQQLIHTYDAKKNNVRDFFDTGWSQKHNIALSGVSKGEEMTYYVSYSYTDNDGMIPTDQDSYRRNTLAFRGSYQPEKWVKVSTAMNLATYKTKTVGSYQGTSVIDGVFEMPRDISIVDMKDLSSPFNTPEAYFTPYGITNPYWALHNNEYTTNGKQVYGKLQLDLMPIKGLTLSYRFGLDYADYDNKMGYPQIALDDALINEDYGYAPSNMNQAGYVYTYYRRSHELNHDFLAVYNSKFLDNRLDLSLTAGVNINERAYTYMTGEADDLAINTGYWQLGNGSNWTSLAEGQMKRRMVGLFGYASVGWDDFIFMDITGRNDWSSTLPLSKNSFFYPGITLSGIFTRFIEDKSVLSFGKIRLAYGKTGNDASPYYTSTNYAQAYTNGYYGSDIIKFPFHGTNAFMASATAGSQTLRPEMTSEFEVGTNLNFFNGRIEFDATYYNRITDDQIFTLPIDPSTGFSYQVTNFGKVRNRGVELMLNVTPIDTRNFNWTIGFNFAKNVNKVLSMPESLEGGKVNIYNFSAGNDAVYMYAEEGMPLGTYYTYLPQFVTDKSSPYYGNPIVDSHGQPVLSDEIQYTGYNMNHKWTGGITTAFTAYGVTLSAAFDIRKGGKMFSRTKNLMQFTGNGKVTEYNERRPFIIPNSVVDNGDGTYSENTTPIYLSDSSYQTYFNDYGWGNGGMAYLIDRSYCKLRNISLAWSIPKKWLKPIDLKEVVVTAYCNNAFIWTAKDNRYVDPESTTVTNSGDLAYGFGELYTNPSSRTFGLNLKVNF
ncbi:SusC/RagA family TonB-linked outer membrane protein [uncultured Muribaculum sp.]|uniref:SusC/RagA family TonB-linked outer membrane protein n=1 Tax=uncultured Muribaculum sp. TaxID=1918613 RepID=UPI00263BD3A5|nr:SusC/RagA family TonB-linked outer membrane protein [uncultured Muribaculum sp.]